MTKLHFSEKVDRALEELKECLEFDDSDTIWKAANNLVNVIEEEKEPNDPIQTFTEEEIEEKLSDISKKQEDIKLPEVGKRYKNKVGKIYEVLDSREDGEVLLKGEFGNVVYWIQFMKDWEELPEDSIGKTPDYVKFTVGNQFVPMGEEQKEWVCLAGGGGGSKSKSIWKDVSELPDEEELIDIPEYEGFYQASRNGKIFSLIRRQYLRLSHNSKGYLYVNLLKNNKRTTIAVHRIIAKTFLKDFKDELTVNHKDENKTNNHYLNLECVKITDNIKYGSGIDRSAVTRMINRLEKRVRILEGKSNETLKLHPNAKKDKK